MITVSSRWFLVFSLFLIITSSFSQLSGSELDELRESLQRQDARIRRMQSLIAEQNARQDGIEQTQPPLDLIESLYEDLNRMQEELQNLWPRLVAMEEQMERQWAEALEAHKDDLKLGMLALMAGNPDSAAEWFKPFLTDDSQPQLRSNLLMALANSYLEQGFAEQAASYYGTVIGQPDRGRHYPLALFSLGRAFEMLGEKNKRDVVWRELSENFSEHPLTLQAQLSQKSILDDQILNDSIDNQSVTEKSEEPSVIAN